MVPHFPNTIPLSVTVCKASVCQCTFKRIQACLLDARTEDGHGFSIQLYHITSLEKKHFFHRKFQLLRHVFIEGRKHEALHLTV